MPFKIDSSILYQGLVYYFNINQPVVCGFTLNFQGENPNCYFATSPNAEVIRMGSFIGSVAEGGTVNYQSLTITPHGNGTHTECYGHIADSPITISDVLQPQFFLAALISCQPSQVGVDCMVDTQDVMQKLAPYSGLEAICIRTLPNDKKGKSAMQYSGTNPTYMAQNMGLALRRKGILHWLVDVPSVDKEVDGGMLRNHNGFWPVDGDARSFATITELAFFPNNLPDGLYMLHIDMASVNVDAMLSKPLLYPLAIKN